MERQQLPWLVIGMVAIVLVPTVAASSASLSATGNTQVVPGETITVTFTLNNLASENKAYILDLSVPDGWEIISHKDDDGTWNPSDGKWLWRTVESNERLNPSITVRVSNESDPGEYEIKGTAKTANGVQASDTLAISVSSPSDTNTTTVTPTYTSTGQGNTSTPTKTDARVSNESTDGEKNERELLKQIRGIGDAAINRGMEISRPVAVTIADTIGVNVSLGYTILGVVGATFCVGLFRRLFQSR